MSYAHRTKKHISTAKQYNFCLVLSETPGWNQWAESRLQAAVPGSPDYVSRYYWYQTGLSIQIRNFLLKVYGLTTRLQRVCEGKGEGKDSESKVNSHAHSNQQKTQLFVPNDREGGGANGFLICPYIEICIYAIYAGST